MEYIRYTREEICILEGNLGPLYYLQVRDLVSACNVVTEEKADEEVAYMFLSACLSAGRLSRESIELLFHETLDNVPLYINAKDPVMRAVAKWRLAIAR
jgi:hypothetical protein